MTSITEIIGQHRGYHFYLRELVKLWEQTPISEKGIETREKEYYETIEKEGMEPVKKLVHTSKWKVIRIRGEHGHIQSADAKLFAV